MSTSKCAWHVAVPLLAATWVLAPSPAFSQPSEADTGEVAVLFGGTFGVSPQAAVGSSAGINFSRYGMFLLETAFMPLGNHTIQPWPPTPSVKRSYCFDFGSDFHIKLPIKERWEPYGIAGAGFLWNIIHQDSVDSRGLPVVYKWDQFNAAFHTGAGLRYYIRPHWGIRPELKIIASKETYYRLSVGIFYVTSGPWP